MGRACWLGLGSGLSWVDSQLPGGEQQTRTPGTQEQLANLGWREQLLPPDGVYATWAVVDGASHPAVTNVGKNPTVAGQRRTVETYILNESLYLYGRDLSVAFLSRLREERTFPSLEALSGQIGRDVEAAKKLFDSEKKTVYNPKGLW